LGKGFSLTTVLRSGWLCALLAIFIELLCACGHSPASGPGKPEPTPASSSTARAVGRYDLERDEERGGHTLSRHVGRTDAELEERLRHERNISAASTWTDRETADETVAAALRAERGRIERWTQRGYPRTNLALHYNAGAVIGRSWRRGDSRAADCSSAVIVLRAAGPDSYFVLTSYPEAQE